jgi:transcriptional regulator with XRE-family HTH domain
MIVCQSAIAACCQNGSGGLSFFDMTTIHEALVEQLIAERKKAGLTQSGLAKALREHQSWVSRLESGDRRIDIEEFVTLGKIIGFNPVSLLRKVVKDANGE